MSTNELKMLFGMPPNPQISMFQYEKRDFALLPMRKSTAHARLAGLGLYQSGKPV